jgi:hypothetical protein
MTVSLRAIVFGRRSDGILLVRFTCLICSQMVVGQKRQNVPIPPFANCVTGRAEKIPKITDGSCPLLAECLTAVQRSSLFFHVSIEALQLILRQSYLSRPLLMARIETSFPFFEQKKKTSVTELRPVFFVESHPIWTGYEHNTNFLGRSCGGQLRCGVQLILLIPYRTVN